VPLQGEEIKRRLTEFAEKWTVYEGSERAEAQTFLKLFACYGTTRESVASFEASQHGRFLDLIWPRTCLIEMKRPSEANRLAEHRAQAFDYWRHSADPDTRIPAPKYIVICAFRRFEVWEPGPLQPVAVQPEPGRWSRARGRHRCRTFLPSDLDGRPGGLSLAGWPGPKRSRLCSWPWELSS
jgi:hypothetical protein